MDNLQRDLIQNLKGGASVETALASNGITQATFDDWMTEEAFAAEVEQAQAKARAIAEVSMLKDRPAEWLKRQRPMKSPSPQVPIEKGKCQAHTTSGRPCRNWAIKGATVCRNHGGSAPQVRKAANQRLARAKVADLMEKMGVRDEDPLIGLMREVSRSATAAEILGSLVGDLDVESELFGPNHAGDGAAHILYKMWSEERDRHARFCKMALDAGVAERQVELAEEQGAMLARVITAVFDDPSMGLSNTQRVAGKRIAARHLKALPSA